MRPLILLLLLAALPVFGQEAREGASFKEGVGVLLGAATRAAIGLTVAEVEERTAPRNLLITAQVYREAGAEARWRDEPPGFAHASAWVDSPAAGMLVTGTALRIQGPQASSTGAVVRLVHPVPPDSRRVEVLFRFQDRDRAWQVGEFVHAFAELAPAEAVPMIPHTAVLESAFGAFAYVVNGGAYLRTAIGTGARRGDYIEITDGLYGGDQVVTHPVETLYLIELRATKGGGHSH
ncbi:MAG TPA: hypothetical protein PKE12_03460 [Kiritimatiellia bacterium]|nr:hypothetical protein [Kiritimatiellia bacterium]